MFIRSSTAINDCLIALDAILGIGKEKNRLSIVVTFKTVDKEAFAFIYKSEQSRDKAFEELCVFINNNYKLRDFT
jgi:hypothetical protein